MYFFGKLFATKCSFALSAIPHFKEVVIMSTTCDSCGHRTNEVKSGGGIEEKGSRITLKVTDPSDLSRDLLKSETCSVRIPELELEVGGFALGGRFTTVEGLLRNVCDQLESNPFLGMGLGEEGGDATLEEKRRRMSEFRDRMGKMADGEETFTLQLDDPAGNSYLQVKSCAFS